MKKILLLIPCFLFITFSCSKDNSSSSNTTTTTKNPLYGKWKVVSRTEDKIDYTNCIKSGDTTYTIDSTHDQYYESEVIENDSIYTYLFNPTGLDIIDYFLVGDSKFYTYANSVEGDTVDYRFEDNNNTLFLTGYHRTSCNNTLIKSYGTDKLTRIK